MGSRGPKKVEKRSKKPAGLARVADLPAKRLTADQEKNVKAGLLVVIAKT